MKCRIKRINNDVYFNRNIGFQNHWTFIDQAKVFNSVAKARATIKAFDLKNVEIKGCDK